MLAPLAAAACRLDLTPPTVTSHTADEQRLLVVGSFLTLRVVTGRASAPPAAAGPMQVDPLARPGRDRARASP